MAPSGDTKKKSLKTGNLSILYIDAKNTNFTSLDNYSFILGINGLKTCLKLEKKLSQQYPAISSTL